MPEAEQKQCPRCGTQFSCHQARVAQCQCCGVGLTPAQREYIAARHADCLCRTCLEALREEQAAYAAGT